MKNDTILTTSATENEERVSISRAEYEALKAENAELNQKLDFLMGQLRLMKKKAFGTSSEKAGEELIGQLSFLFNEAEVWKAQEKKPLRLSRLPPIADRSVPVIWMRFCRRVSPLRWWSMVSRSPSESVMPVVQS